MLTQKELKDNLKYNKDSGVFIRKKSNTNRVNIGDIAGTLSNNGYISITINGRRYQAHQLAWLYEYGVFPDKCIDHINRVKTDNRFCNLRNIDRWKNNVNKDLQKNNKTGYVGVNFIQKSNKYHARIKIHNKNIHLGYFDKIDDAITVRKRAEKKYFFNN